MASVRSVGTRPEIVVRKFLHHSGFRFRIAKSDLPGRPDVVLRKYKTVVFIHGCFWHGHRCQYGNPPKSNLTYWLPKLERNRERDRKNTAALRRLGWTVLVIWQCQLRNPEKLHRLLHPLVKRRRPFLKRRVP
jgi:DNA mismatch endonuclease Vsr